MAQDDMSMDDPDFGDNDPDFEDDDFGDNDPDFEDEDFGDEDFGDDAEFDDGDDDWGDVVEDDGFNIQHDPDALEKARKEKEEAKENQELQNAEWTCLECKYKNKGMGLLCLGCNKPNLGELDRQKRRRELKEAQFWADIFAETYLPLQLHLSSQLEYELDASIPDKHLRNIFAHEMVERKIPELKLWKESDLSPACESCTCDFDEFTCHANICKQCCGNWIRAKISEENVIPFVRCPAEDCDCPIPAFVYMDEGLKLKTSDLYKMVSVYCEKQLARNSNWVSCCNTKSCKYGVLLKLNENEKEIECMFYQSHESADYYFFSTDSGDNCGTKQTVKKKTEFDEGFKEMLKSGKIRKCPKCDFAHMKDKGLCNVLQCGKCKIWWNWRSREMHNTQKGLKEIARRNRTLWEPGELEYQMKLERDDPAAFRHLLESNGIKYDPNYRRGGH